MQQQHNAEAGAQADRDAIVAIAARMRDDARSAQMARDREREILRFLNDAPRQHREPRLHVSDYYFLAMMLVCAVVVLAHWENYSECKDPLQVWLFVDYLGLFSFRLLHFAVQKVAARRGEARNPTLTRRLLAALILVAYPFMWIWNILGTVWISRSEHGKCLPERSNYWGVVIWIAIGYFILVVYGIGSWLSLRSLRRNRDFRRRADAARDFDARLQDLVERNFIQQLLRNAGEQLGGGERGLSDSQLGDLPTHTLDTHMLSSIPQHQHMCPICMDEMQVGDAVLKTPCGHVFHKTCVSQWLTQNNDCPVCRQPVWRQNANGEQVRQEAPAQQHDDIGNAVARIDRLDVV